MTTERIIVLGDIGAQTAVFENCLIELGIDPSHPVITDPDVTIVQLGDVTRGLAYMDSYGSAILADKLLRLNPGRYHQLLGNHDMPYVGGYALDRWELDERVEPVMRSWWDEGLCNLALTIEGADGSQTLITHAGLTRARWERFGSLDAVHTASAINQAVGGDAAAHEDIGFLVNRKPNPLADTQWAEIGSEMLAGWMNGQPVPFDQLHGHATPLNWDGGFWHDTVTARMRAATQVHGDARVTVTRVGKLDGGDDAFITTVDWTLGNDMRSDTFRLWELEGVIVN